MNCCGGGHGHNNRQNHGYNQEYNHGNNNAGHHENTNSNIKLMMVVVGAVVLAGIALYFLR